MSKDLMVVRQALQQTNDLGQYLMEVVDHVEGVKNEVDEVKDDFNHKYLEMTEAFEKFKETTTLQNSEIEELSGLVKDKTRELTIDFFDGEKVSEKLFLAKYVHLNRGVYQSIKDHLGVTGSYKLIKHIDYDRAVEYTKGITLHHLRPYYLRLTKHQQSLL